MEWNLSQLDQPDQTPDGWTLDDIMESAPQPHLPMTSKHKKQRGETQVLSARVSLEDYAKIQKTVQQRRIPGIETYSDLVNDAIFMWLEKFYEENPTFDPNAAQELRMRRLEAEINTRKSFLELATETLDGLTRTGDIRGLEQYLVILVESRYDFTRRDAPENYIEDIDKLLEVARRLIDRSK